MKDAPAFKEAYVRLNDAQKQAVDAIDGPVFVIAGPGTGKTQVLTLRIANILQKTDTPPDAILALTFTESAVSTLRARLAASIGSTTAWKVRIHTFHGFAEYLISRYPDAFPRIIGGQIATDAERAEILESVLLAAPVTHLRPYGDPLYYFAIAKGAIDTLKRENVTPEKLLALVTESEREFEAIPDKVHEKGKYEGKMKGEFETMLKKIEKTRDLYAVYAAYEAELTARKRYDFADLILEAVRALSEDESLKRQVQESLLYVLADEHQDANASQNALLELLTDYDESPNLFIVGDEKQAIYRFQGADLDNVHFFRTRFPGTRIVALVENYRSTQTILDVALSLVAASPDERLSRAALASHSELPARPIKLLACASPEQEMAELVAAITTLIAEGTPAEDIAVFGRRNADVGYIAAALTSEGIAVAAAGSGAFENRYARALIRLLRAVATPGDEQLASIMLLPAFSLSAADVWRVRQAAKQERVPMLSLMLDEQKLSAAGVSDPENAHAIASHMETLARLAAIARPGEVAQEALALSGLLPQILAAPDRSESLASIRAILTAFEDIASREHDALLPRALAVLDLMEARSIALSSDVAEVSGRVKVMTVHKAKGREFAHVFIPRLTQSAWSTRTRAEHFRLPDLLTGSNELEDERRLLYVAITRAKVHATLSYALTRTDGKEDAPSELIDDLDPALVQRATSTIEVPDPLLRERATPTRTGAPSADDLATLRQAFLSQGLSPTALNNYLECPWHYFYVNLLRIPEVENKYMLYGTAIHAALFRYASQRNQGSDIGVDGLMGSFMHSLSRAPLSMADLSELEIKGRRALTNWWEQQHESWPARVEAEVAVQAEIALGEDTLLLRGKLDRIDERGGGVSVVDYKTGKAKSRNELMGGTKNATGDYYRQLTFYKLLLERTDAPRTMTEGVIEFVEPDDKDRIRTEAFMITDAEVSELVEVIKTSAGEILSLSFWNDPCDEKECRWCAMRFTL